MSIEIYCVDPGPRKSGVAILEMANDGRLLIHKPDQSMSNKSIVIGSFEQGNLYGLDIVCEDVSSYGMAVGRDVFETVKIIGYLEHACGAETISRSDVKLTLLGGTKGTDAQVNARCREIISTVNEIPEHKLKGTKKAPGPCYGVAGHAWSAVAVGLAYLWPRGLADAYLKRRGLAA